MKTIYVDSEFKCHVTNDGTMTAVETDLFDGKCDTFIEGYRFIPEDHTWTRSDGVVFHGEMITPWKSYSELETVQRRYEIELNRERIKTLEENYAVLLECLLEMSEIVYA